MLACWRRSASRSYCIPEADTVARYYLLPRGINEVGIRRRDRVKKELRAINRMQMSIM